MCISVCIVWKCVMCVYCQIFVYVFGCIVRFFVFELDIRLYCQVVCVCVCEVYICLYCQVMCVYLCVLCVCV